MTGPEHYEEAQRLLMGADNFDSTELTAQPIIAEMLARAQVHATLALAAATAVSQNGDMPIPDCDDWLAVASGGTR